MDTKPKDITVKIRRTTHDKIEQARIKAMVKRKNPKLSLAAFLDELITEALKSTN